MGPRLKEIFLRFWSKSFKDGGKIPKDYAFGKHMGVGHVGFSKNLNPSLEWADLPPETQSLVIIMHDVDAPSKAENINQEDSTIPLNFPRSDFYHWVLVDLNPQDTPLLEAEFSSKVTAHGKSGLKGPRNTRQGLNGFTDWFKGDKNMEGNYFGYDGPAPPWNDERVHHYFYTLYALKEKRCPLKGLFTGPQVIKAIKDITLEQSQFSGTYAINPKAKNP
jgi:Raf kinase inhibitor-like YbhB/YbcL family protein